MKKWMIILLLALAVSSLWSYRGELQSGWSNFFEDEKEPVRVQRAPASRNAPAAPTTPAASPTPRVTQPKGPFRVLGTFVTEREARAMYAKVQGKYVMVNGSCYHSWQAPEGSPLTYAEFIRELQKGTHFPQLSEYDKPRTLLKPKHIN